MSQASKKSQIREGLEIEGLLGADSAKYVGEYRPIQAGNSQGCRVPQPVASWLGVVDCEVVHTYADIQRGFVVHFIPQDGSDHTGGPDLEEIFE